MPATDPQVERLPAPFPDVATQPGRRFPALDHLSLRAKTYRRLLARHLAGPPGRRLLDMGAGTGQFARIAAREGFAVTAVDAREPWTLARERSLAPSREYVFVRSDLRDFTDLDGFDVIALIGVIYHLTLDDQVALLRRCEGKTVVIDTELFDERSLPAERRQRFAPRVTPEGYRGADCVEVAEVYSSHLNPTSFWFEDDSFLKFLADVGRTRVRMVDPPYRSPFGPRRWYLLDG